MDSLKIRITICFSVKTNYYKLARVYHPDRVDVSEKSVANEKFNILHQAYLILANPETKKLYDAGDTHCLFVRPTIALKWEQYIKTIDSVEYESAQRKYQGSSKEENDIIREFVFGKGSITHLFNVIPFMRYEDEARIIEIIKRCMQCGKIPKFITKGTYPHS